VRNLFLQFLQSSIITLKSTIAAVFDYFLQDADVQNVVVGGVIILQITSFITRQVYLKTHLFVSTLLHAVNAKTATVFNKTALCLRQRAVY
jgi:hypothetical protein